MGFKRKVIHYWYRHKQLTQIVKIWKVTLKCYKKNEITSNNARFIVFLAQNRILLKYMNKLPDDKRNAFISKKKMIHFFDEYNKIRDTSFFFPISFSWGDGKFWLNIHKKWLAFYSRGYFFDERIKYSFKDYYDWIERKIK